MLFTYTSTEHESVLLCYLRVEIVLLQTNRQCEKKAEMILHQDQNRKHETGFGAEAKKELQRWSKGQLLRSQLYLTVLKRKHLYAYMCIKNENNPFNY